jgi:hypothetical protein
MKVKLAHNQDRVWISFEQEHPSCYFPLPHHLFSFQEHPTTITKAQDKHLGPAQAKEHVFQDFCMLPSKLPTSRKTS